MGYIRREMERMATDRNQSMAYALSEQTGISK